MEERLAKREIEERLVNAKEISHHFTYPARCYGVFIWIDIRMSQKRAFKLSRVIIDSCCSPIVDVRGLIADIQACTSPCYVYVATGGQQTNAGRWELYSATSRYDFPHVPEVKPEWRRVWKND